MWYVVWGLWCHGLSAVCDWRISWSYSLTIYEVSYGKGLTSWLSCMWYFIVFSSLSHVVSWVMCGAWLYRFLIFAFFFTFIYTSDRKCCRTFSVLLHWGTCKFPKVQRVLNRAYRYFHWVSNRNAAITAFIPPLPTLARYISWCARSTLM